MKRLNCLDAGVIDVLSEELVEPLAAEIPIGFLNDLGDGYALGQAGLKESSGVF